MDSVGSSAHGKGGLRAERIHACHCWFRKCERTLGIYGNCVCETTGAVPTDGRSA
jgi:hypothetical protein